jgi:hypothetical protein
VSGENTVANPFGLFDMIGGADEWCWDSVRSLRFAPSPYSPQQVAAIDDPVAAEGDAGVKRGGSFFSDGGTDPKAVSSFSRSAVNAANSGVWSGFGRVVLPIVLPRAPQTGVLATHAFREWIKEVRELPAEAQVAAVVSKVRELNPGFDGQVKVKIESGIVTELEFRPHQVSDISPVRALAGLRVLILYGGEEGRGKVSDLSPLRGMQLTKLDCGATAVTDLAPLSGMKLEVLSFTATEVSDLSPLKGMPLTQLDAWNTKISDLSPLRGMPLVNLACNQTRVSDLSPLAALPLRSLHCEQSLVTDLAPLKGLPLKSLFCDFQPERDKEMVRSIKTLETINNKPAAEFWKDVDTPP